MERIDEMITGKRIILRTINPDELDYVYGLIHDLSVKGPYWHLAIQPLNKFREEYRQTGFWSQDEGRMLIVSHDGDYLGEIVYFKGLDYQAGFEVGYELFKQEYGGKGYMTEALQLFCGFMFATRPINRIQINVMSGNTASRKVVEKCGFVHEGTMRKATFHNGEYQDLELYSLLREEFTDKPDGTSELSLF
jgi:ribosomal-protein-alanine N-acetyltransferase